MAIQSAGRGRDTHLIKITLGKEPGTGKRRYYTETFKGTKKEARLREAELKVQHRDKGLKISSGMTFRLFFDSHFSELRARLSLSCFDVCEKYIKRYLLPSVGDKKLRDLVRDDFQQVYDSMSVRGLSPYTIHALNRAAQAAIRCAMAKGLLGDEIVKGVKLPKLPKPRPEFLSYEEMQAFFDVAPNYRYGDAFKLQFMTGLRNQELMALAWTDINFETATIRVHRACIWVGRQFKGFKGTKTGEERTLELDPKTVDFLKNCKIAQQARIKSRKDRGLSYGDERLIFCTEDGRVPHSDALRKCFRHILNRIEVTRRFRWYGIRHTHATHLLDTEGANAKMIANRMGHSVGMLFRTYAHEMPGQQRDAVSKLSSRVTL